MVKFEDLKDMATKFAEDFATAINESKAYARSGKKWGIDFDGSMLFVFQASGEVEEDFSLFIDLQTGKCLSTQILGPGEEPPRQPPMVITAPMSAWKSVIFKEIDPVAAMMQKVLNLEGDMSLVMRYAQAAIDLVSATEQADRSLFTSFDLG